jgi:UDP-N-acetylmuramoylalanine--D-glutamate ligase
VVLICGGYDKGDQFDHLAQLYKEKVSYGICIGDTAEKFRQIFQKENIANEKAEALHEAIEKAFHYAEKNNSDILFSPGCASFGMFRNVYHRIEEFEKEIGKLKEITQS